MGRVRFCRISGSAAVSVAALALMLGGCAINPVSKRPELVTRTASSERDLGAREAKKVENFIGYAGDRHLQAYVSQIGSRLAKFSPRQDVDYQFHVVDMVEPNAFALPGGFIYVSRGLLALCNSEAELANVLGHELAHVAARHSMQQETRGVLMSPITLVTGIAGAATSIVSPTLGGAVAGVGTFAGQLVMAPYSRDQEREADHIGMNVAAESGFDPAGMAGFLTTLERELTLVHGREANKTSFFDSHPSTPERITNARALADEMQIAEPYAIAGTRRAFYGELDGLVVGDDPSEGVLVPGGFVQPVLDFRLDFPKGWLSQNMRHQVAAIAPNGEAYWVMEALTEGDDPLIAADAVKGRIGFKLTDVQRATINGLPAARLTMRARTSGAAVMLDLTWIAHHNVVYQMGGVTPASKFDTYRDPLVGISESFRPLDVSEIADLRVSRIRTVDARAGESLERLLDRSNSGWGPAQAAVANAIQLEASLEGGHPVKVAVDQPFDGEVRRAR
jgi:predicted Zn-dependent protease